MIGVGSKVVCVKDFNLHYYLSRGWSFPNGITVTGQVYCVSDIYIDNSFNNMLCFRFVGLSSYDGSGALRGWRAERFRELEHEQMRSELEYLRTQPKQEPAYQP